MNFSDFRDFLAREKIFILLLVIVIAMSIFSFMAGTTEMGLKGKGIRAAKDSILKKKYPLTPEKLKNVLEEKKEVVRAMNFLFLIVLAFLVSGLALNGYFLFTRPIKRIRRIAAGGGIVAWGLWDVCRAVIVFLFAGYMVILLEGVLAGFFPAVKDRESIRMMVNSSMLDGLVAVFILYTVAVRYKESLKTLGLHAGDFFKNTFTAIVGYISAFPLIIAALIFVVWFAQRIDFEPPMEPILRLFLEERNPVFILYSTVFVTVLGPVFEEMFFRGFMYPALKKRIGIIGAVGLSSFLFSILHTNIIGFLPIMVLGVLLACLYERTGSLVSPVVVHVIHNTGMMTLVFLMKEINA